MSQSHFANLIANFLFKSHLLSHSLAHSTHTQSNSKKLETNLLHGRSLRPWGPIALDSVVPRCGLPAQHGAVGSDPQFSAAGGEVEAAAAAAAGSGLDRTRYMLHWAAQTGCYPSNWLQSSNGSPSTLCSCLPPLEGQRELKDHNSKADKN